MKNMKKILISLIATIVLFIGVSDVTAASMYVGQNFSRSEAEVVTNGITEHFYRFGSDDGTKVVGYCLDPQLSSSENVTTKRLLLEAQDYDSSLVKMSEGGESYDFGLYAILLNGYHEATGGTGSAEEMATMIAIRAWTNAYNYGRRTYTGDFASLQNYLAKESAYINLGIDWAVEDWELASNLLCRNCNQSQLKSYLESRDYGSWYKSSVKIGTSGTSYVINGNIYNEAHRLFKIALEEANKYLEGKSEYYVASVDVHDRSDIQFNSNGQMTGEIKTIRFTINHFSKKGEVNNISVTCSDCAEKGMTLGDKIEYYDPADETWKTLTPETNLVEFINSDNVAQIRFEITKDPEMACSSSPAHYTVTYNQCDPYQGFTAAILEESSSTDKSVRITNNGSGGSGGSGGYTGQTQRFAAIVDSGTGAGSGYGASTYEDAGDGVESGSLNSNIDTYCANGGGSTQTYSGTIKCVSKPCPSKITYPICTLGEDDVDENENPNGKEGDPNAQDTSKYVEPTKGEDGNIMRGASNFTAPEEITACILENYDDAGNSYQLTEDNGGVDNDYCEVYCKEDYIDVFDDENINSGLEFTYRNSIELNTTCGGYFKLSAHIEGKKDCYTTGVGVDKTGENKEKNTEINQNQFVSDTKAILQSVVSTYNDIVKYKAISLGTPESVTQNIWGTCSVDCEKDETGCNNGKKDVPCVIDSCTRYVIKVDNVPQYSVKTPLVHEEKEEYRVNEPTYTTVSYGFGGSLGGGNADGGSSTATSCKDGNSATLSAAAQALMTGTATSTYSVLGKDGMSYSSTSFSYTKGMGGPGYAGLYEKLITTYNGCLLNDGGWKNNYIWKQEIGFEYAETEYFNLLSDNQKKLVADNETLVEDGETEICVDAKSSGSVVVDGVDEYYKCKGKSLTYELDSNQLGNTGNSVLYKDIFVDYCTTSGGDNDLGGCGVDIAGQYEGRRTRATHVRKTSKKAQDYTTPTVYYQIPLLGTVTVDSSYTGPDLQMTVIEHGLPVSPSATGMAKYRLMVRGLGEFYDTGDIGRILDFDPDKYPEGHRGDSVGGVLNTQNESKGLMSFDGEYVCIYDVQCRDVEECPNCIDYCVDDDGILRYYPEWCPDKENPGCPLCNTKCINCLWTEGELKLNYKTVSTTNFLTADREYGYNWNINTTYTLQNGVSMGVITDKAEDTIKEITEQNETIYDGKDVTNYKDTDNTTLDFSIKLTSAMITDIREYNKKQEEYGGYTNDSLTCYDYNNGGVTYQNLFCYSDFIDDLYRDYDGLIVAPNRPEVSGDASQTASARKNNPNSSNYWTLWEETLNESYKESLQEHTVIGGPAWK